MINIGPIQYEERVVAFVDLLGFKNAVNESINKQNIFNDISKALKLNEQFQKDNYGVTFMNEAQDGVEIMFFSDSFVISIPTITYDGPLYSLLMHLVWQALDILDNNFLVRGGVTIGLLYHNGNICFGPAMNRAYYLESKEAFYPRIIIDEFVLKRMDSLKSSNNTIGEERQFLNKLVKRDVFDNKLFLDYLSQSQELYINYNDNNKYIELLKKVKVLVERNLNYCNISLMNTYCEDKIIEIKKVLNKYLWYKEYYNDTIQKVLLPERQDEFLIK